MTACCSLLKQIGCSTPSNWRAFINNTSNAPLHFVSQLRPVSIRCAEQAKPRRGSSGTALRLSGVAKPSSLPRASASSKVQARSTAICLGDSLSGLEQSSICQGCPFAAAGRSPVKYYRLQQHRWKRNSYQHMQRTAIADNVMETPA